MLLFYLSLVETEEEKIKIEKLYYQYKNLMMHIATDILKDDGYAEDAVHESFVKLTKHLNGIDDVNNAKTKAFVVIIVKNTCLDMLQKEKRNKVSSCDNMDEILSNTEKTFEKIEVKELVSLIDKLPEIYRDVVQLKVTYELTDKEIAHVLGISNQAVRKRLQRARESFGKILAEWDENNID